MRRCGPAIGNSSKGVVVAAMTVMSAALAVAGPARDEKPPAETRIAPYRGVIPACDDPGVLSEVASGFAGREREFWGSPLAIVGFERVSESGYRTNGSSYIPRRFCRGEALFSDGERRRLVYNIAEAQGFLGIGPGVTWCVVGLDRNHAFSPNCRAAGP